MKPIVVLSLFDGISGGRLALERTGIPIEIYYASEIDKYAISITQHNYPNTIQLGDVEKIDFTQYEGKIDLLIGGSPCTNLSIAGNRKGLEGDESRLFWEYVRAIKECKPKYFFLENVESMTDSDKEIISKELGCYPICINSALLSGQNRKRYYWFNWGKKQINLFGFPTCDIPQPEDKGILLKDVLETGVAPDEKSRAIISSIGRTTEREYFKKNQGKMVAEPICINSQSGRGDNSTAQPSIQDRIYDINGKSTSLTTSFLPNVAEPITPYVAKKYKEYAEEHDNNIPVMFNPYNKAEITDKSPALLSQGNSQTKSDTVMLFEPIGVDVINKGNDIKGILNKSYCLLARDYKGFNNAGMTGVVEPIRIGHLGKGGQAQRIFSVKGKSISLIANGGGQGGKTGLYKIDLPDGDYIIRKLTPIECERLQTFPDGWTEYGIEGRISNTQRYKCIGNSWTVDVISYILGFLREELDK